MRRIAVALLVVALRARAESPEEAAQRLVDSGQSLYTLGDYEMAQRDFAAAQALVPGKPNPWRLLGLALARLGRCPDAIGWFDGFLKLVPKEDPRVAEVAGERQLCEAGLPPKPVSLTVETEPSGATVRLDGGKPVGTTPWRGTVAPGKRALALDLPGFQIEKRELALEPGGVALLRLALSPVPPAPKRERRWLWPLVATASVLAVGGLAAGLAVGLNR